MCCFKDLTDITDCGVLLKIIVRYCSGLEVDVRWVQKKFFVGEVLGFCLRLWGCSGFCGFLGFCFRGFSVRMNVV
jgi:hypothetical protein